MITAQFPPSKIGSKSLKGVEKILYVDSADSTQDLAKELVKGRRNASSLLVIAGEQHRGRGRMERGWESAPGGLYMSLALHPDTHAGNLSELSIKIAHTAARAVETLWGIKTKIKAPNDVFAYEPRRKSFFKIAGILTEGSTFSGPSDWLVIGIGVNLNNALSKELLATATTAARITGKEVSGDEFLKVFFDFFWDTYTAWEMLASARMK